jgi:hypothetical protein
MGGGRGEGGKGGKGGNGSYSDSFLIHQMDSPYSHIITVTDEMHCYNQCSGSVTFWYGSGSVNPYHGLTDPEPFLFVSDL